MRGFVDPPPHRAHRATHMAIIGHFHAQSPMPCANATPGTACRAGPHGGRRRRGAIADGLRCHARRSRGAPWKETNITRARPRRCAATVATGPGDGRSGVRATAGRSPERIDERRHRTAGGTQLIEHSVDLTSCALRLTEQVEHDECDTSPLKILLHHDHLCVV